LRLAPLQKQERYDDNDDEENDASDGDHARLISFRTLRLDDLTCGMAVRWLVAMGGRPSGASLKRNLPGMVPRNPPRQSHDVILIDENVGTSNTVLDPEPSNYLG
jgi:hypothetical protein